MARPLRTVSWVVSLVLGCLALCGPRVAPHAFGDLIDSTWTSGSGDWSAAANWSNGVPNGVGHVARLEGALARTVTIDASVPGQGATAGTVYLYGVSAFPGFSLDAAPGKSLTMDVSVGDARIEAAGPRGSDIHAPLVLNDTTRFSTPGTLKINVWDTIGGGRADAGLTKTGSGDMALYGQNSYQGPTHIEEGSLAAVYPESLGVGPASVTVADGATLYFGLATPSEPYVKELILEGGEGAEGLGALSGAGTWAGPITLAGDAAVGIPWQDLQLILAGPVSGPGKLIKCGEGDLVINRASTWTGGVQVAEGRLTVRAPGTFGTGPAPVTVEESGCLTLEGGTASDNPLILRGYLEGNGGDNQWNGTVTVADHPRVWLLDGFVTVNGPIDGDGTLEVKGNPDRAIFGGTLVLAGASTHTGPTILDGGTLEACDGAGLSIGSNLVFDGGIFQGHGETTFTRNLGAGPGEVQWSASGGFAARGGKMTVNIGGRTRPQTLVWDSTPCFLPDGRSLTLNGTSSDSEVEFVNPINLGGKSRTFAVPDNPDSGSDFATVSGILTNGGVETVGDGTVVFAVPNAYTGATVLQTGALRATDGVGLPSRSNLVIWHGVLEGNGPTTFTRSLGPGSSQVQWDATYGSEGGFAAHGGKMTVNLGGQAAKINWGSTPYFVPNKSAHKLGFGSATADAEVEFLNPIKTNANSEFYVRDNPHAPGDFATLAGVISGGQVTKRGDGTLVLSAPNTYTGITQVSHGALRAQLGVGLPTDSRLSLLGTGVYESSGTTSFTRNLGNASGELTFYAGGFSAHGGRLTVNIGGRRQTLVWGVTPYFLPDDPTVYYGILTFGSATADSEVLFENPIDLDGEQREIHVRDNPFADGDFATLARIQGNGQLTKTGAGRLVVSADTRRDGVTTVAEGTLQYASGATFRGGLHVADGAVFDGAGLRNFRIETGSILSGDGDITGSPVVYGTVAPGGSVGAMELSGLTLKPGATLAMELGGPLGQRVCDRLTLLTGLFIEPGATLHVTAADLLPLDWGDGFTLLDVGVCTGEFTTLLLPELDPGLEWNTDDLYTGGTLVIIPEPATVGFAVAGLALILGRWARRRR